MLYQYIVSHKPIAGRVKTKYVKKKEEKRKKLKIKIRIIKKKKPEIIWFMI
jgi:hypothetical protein